MNTRPWPLLLLAVLLAWSPPALAQDTRSLDEQLLDDLNRDTLDDVDRELFGPDEKPRPGDTPPGDDDLDRRLQGELGSAAVSEDVDPRLDIARQMREAELRIRQHDSGEATQRVQGEIVDQLQRLIEQYRKQCQACNKSGQGAPQKVTSRAPVGQPKANPGGRGGSGNRPATDSQQQVGRGTPPPRQVDLEQVRDLIKELWGQLPARDREQMPQSPPEEFLPKYELLIEEYFRRLSGERETLRDEGPRANGP